MATMLTERMAELTAARVPFVRATVVRAQEPTSARPGDQAIVLADGSIEGFVGGQCATGSVRTAARQVLDSRASLLLRVLPSGQAEFPPSPGADVVVNACLSGGALEIFLEPSLPAPVLHLVGGSPIADAVASLAGSLGFDVERSADGAGPEGSHAVVVCTHGGDEAAAVRAALDAGVGFVGVVCSRTRGDAVLAELDLGDDERARVHPHVGLDIGARSAQEIALSVVAALVRAIRLEGLTAARAPTVPAQAAALPAVTAIDPHCGMTVTVRPGTPHAVVGGVESWFCGPGCRDAFVHAQAS